MRRYIFIFFYIFFLVVSLSSIGFCEDAVPEASQTEASSTPSSEKESHQWNAEEQSLYEEQKQIIGADELKEATPKEAQEFVTHFQLDQLDPGVLLSMNFHDLISWCWQLILSQIALPLRLFCYLIGILLLCALLNAVQGKEEKTLSGVFRLICVLFLCMLLLQPLLDCIRRMASVFQGVNDFMACYIPIFAGVLAMGGQPATGTGYQVLLFSVVQGVSAIASSVLVPLLFCYLAICLVASLEDGLGLGETAVFLKKVITWTLGILVTIVVGFLTVQSLVASSSDNVTTKAAKFMISSTVPVVGGALSEALGTVKGCVSLLRSSVGYFGIFVVVATFLPLLLELVVWSLITKLGSLCSQLFSFKQLGGLLDGMGAAIGVMMALLCSYALLLILSTTILLLLGGGGG